MKPVHNEKDCVYHATDDYVNEERETKIGSFSESMESELVKKHCLWGNVAAKSIQNILIISVGQVYLMEET